MKSSIVLNSEFKKFQEQTNLLLLIDHSGRAGNGFFLTSFESHPEVLCCPLMHYTYSYCHRMFVNEISICSKEAHHFWTSVYYFSYFYNESNDKTVEFIQKVGGDPGISIDRKKIRKIFDDIVFSHELIDRKKLIFATFFAYAKAIGKDLDALKYLLISDSISLPQESIFEGYSGRIVDDAYNDFNSFVCIHLVRDPRAGFASSNHQFINEAGNMYGISASNIVRVLKNIINGNLSLSNQQNFIFGFWLAYFRQTFLAIEKKKSQYSQNFILVKNEDLNLEFSVTLNVLCKRLNLHYNIGWDQTPFIPTMLGKPWRGTGAYNNRYQKNHHGPLPNDSDDISEKITGPNKYVTQRWKSRLSKSEKKILDYFLSDEIECYGYEFSDKTPISPNFSSYRLELLKPLKGELPSPKWIFQHSGGAPEMLNRLFYYFSFPICYILSRVQFLLNPKYKMLLGK